ncbi:hypothetical protein [Megasphaera elsdenii]|uniref:hypothetical protein n=1 Tax=Megasphaera elsdenii TaxID=907 RepID=UPI0040277AE0
MTKHIFRTKSISEFISETKQDGGMNRVLGTFGLTMLGIGAIVGTGNLCPDWRCRCQLFRSCTHHFIYHCSVGLRLCRPLLC